MDERERRVPFIPPPSWDRDQLCPLPPLAFPRILFFSKWGEKKKGKNLTAVGYTTYACSAKFDNSTLPDYPKKYQNKSKFCIGRCRRFSKVKPYFFPANSIPTHLDLRYLFHIPNLFLFLSAVVASNPRVFWGMERVCFAPPPLLKRKRRMN